MIHRLSGKWGKLLASTQTIRRWPLGHENAFRGCFSFIFLFTTARIVSLFKNFLWKL